MHEMEKWLIKNRMTHAELAGFMGCSRQTIWRIKEGYPVAKKLSKRMSDFTNGEVVPLFNQSTKDI